MAAVAGPTQEATTDLEMVPVALPPSMLSSSDSPLAIPTPGLSRVTAYYDERTIEHTKRP